VRRPLVIVGLIAFVALSAGTWTPAARANTTLWGRSSTYLGGYVKPADDEVASYLPFFEVVELHTRDLGVEGLSLHTGFWGLVDILDKQERTRVIGDLTTLQLDYRVPQSGRLRWLHGLHLTAGRQLVALGPTLLEQLDGGVLRYIHGSGVEIGLFGGAPTGTHLLFQPWPADEDAYGYGANWLAGGRLGYLSLGRLSGGASFVHRRYDGRVADNDLGADLSVSPFSLLDLSGHATVSLEVGRLKEARGGATVRPLRPVTVSLGYRYSSPDLWIPRTSIFAVFSEESFHEAFVDARWRVARSFSVDGSYGRRFYGSSGQGDGGGEVEGADRAGLRAVYRFGNSAARAVAELERIESPDNAANRLRLATTLPFYLWRRTFRLVLDLDLMLLDELMREARLAVLGGAYLEVPLLARLSLLAGGSGGLSPLLSRAGSFTTRLTWSFDWPGQRVEVRRGGM
jgi:hypothetical protein